MSASETELRAAYAECRRLASRHYENFPTASRLVSRDKRDALAAVYAFARYADDVADEPGVENRLEKLAAWRSKLDASYAGEIDHPVFLALHDSAERFELSRENFENLLRAFESDVMVSRHADFGSLLDYCTCSANPVGRLCWNCSGITIHTCLSFPTTFARRSSSPTFGRTWPLIFRATASICRRRI